MSFTDFLSKGWNGHASDPQAVADKLAEGISLIEKPEQISALANLITHVMGEHLAKWLEGKDLLVRLRSSRFFESGSEADEAIARSIAALELAGKLRESVKDFSLSDQIRILAVSSSALSEKDTERAQELFRSALELATKGISKEDPANRALAVTGNNLACALEEKLTRSPSETRLMIMAAQAGRKFWEIAGTWLETERAEYRLAQSYLKAENPDLAAIHAERCLAICNDKKAEALEVFFAYEVLALTEKARGHISAFEDALKKLELNFEKLSVDDKAWCEATLNNLKK